MKKLKAQVANIGKMIREKEVYKIFVQTISIKRGDTQRRSKWEIRAF
jgi:hypothetical protein